MPSTITISCGNQKKSYNVNLSSSNVQKTLSHYNKKTSKKETPLFNFAQKEFKTKDANLFNKICNALNSLMKLGGDKNSIDDADFKKAPVNSQDCKINTWHNDDVEDMNAMDYHTDNDNTFHIA